MPVKHVVLVHLHQIQVVFDDTLGDVVAAGVDQDTAVGEPRGVHDLSPVNDVLDGVTKLHGGVDQLTEGLHAPQDAPDREGNDPGSARFVWRVDLHLVYKSNNSEAGQGVIKLFLSDVHQ